MMARLLLSIQAKPSLRLHELLGAALLVPLCAAIDFVVVLWRAFRPGIPEHLRCATCGRNIDLVAFFACSTCRGTAWRHAFEPCPFCGAESMFVYCACGTTTANRWRQP